MNVRVNINFPETTILSPGLSLTVAETGEDEYELPSSFWLSSQFLLAKEMISLSLNRHTSCMGSVRSCEVSPLSVTSVEHFKSLTQS